LVALKKALEILRELGRLSGLEDQVEGAIVVAPANLSDSRRRSLGSGLIRRTAHKS